MEGDHQKKGSGCPGETTFPPRKSAETTLQQRCDGDSQKQERDGIRLKIDGMKWLINWKTIPLTGGGHCSRYGGVDDTGALYNTQDRKWKKEICDD